MFYRLFFDYNLPGWGLDYPESAKGKYPGTPFTGGKPFLEDAPIHTTIIDITSKPVDFTLVASIPIVHQRFNSASQSVDATAIQRIPIKIFDLEENEYEIMNILKVVEDAIDFDQTKYISYSERSNGEKKSHGFWG